VPGERPPLIDYYGHVYGPGPLVFFRQLEALFDRGAVLSALQSLLGTARAIGVDDVRAALEAATGADLGDYFDAWVYGEGRPRWPEFRVTITDAGAGDVQVHVEQVTPADRLMGCAFAIELFGAGDEDSLEVWFDLGVGGARERAQQVAVPFPVTGHRFDPGAHCLAFETTAALADEPFVHPWRAPSPPVPFGGAR
jgi:aminopeptidase N